MAVRAEALHGERQPARSPRRSPCLGIPLGQAEVSRFSDGEVFVQIDENVRGHDVFIVQPTCPPVNDNLMELLVMFDALKRASARAHHRGDAVLRLRAARTGRCSRACPSRPSSSPT